MRTITHVCPSHPGTTVSKIFGFHFPPRPFWGGYRSTYPPPQLSCASVCNPPTFPPASFFDQRSPRDQEQDHNHPSYMSPPASPEDTGLRHMRIRRGVGFPRNAPASHDLPPVPRVFISSTPADPVSPTSPDSHR